MSEYLRKIVACLEQIEKDEGERLDAVSRLVADKIKNDGLIFTFGCGHSHLPGLDAFYRAGGLANVSLMLDTDLMLHNGVLAACIAEGEEVKTACEKANIASAIKVGRKYILDSIPDREEIEKYEKE